MDNCVIYARFSSHGQNEQSIEAQVRICKEFAESKGLKTINIYSDKAKTGTNDSRPSFQRMIADSQTGAFKYIIVYMFDRFARNRRDSIMYKEMLKDKYGIRVLSALEPITEDEGGEFYEMFLEWNAEKYSTRLSKRVRDGIDVNVSNGLYCGARLIYGYKIDAEPIPHKKGKFIRKVVIDEEAAKIVLFVFEQYDKGVTKKDIASILNSNGHRIDGKPFTGKTFDRFLNNRKYTGEFIFGGRQCNNMYPQIVPVELFDRVQKRLEKNRYFAGGVSKARIPYLLTGKLFCGHCGTEMVSDGGVNHQGIAHYYYTCKKRKKQQCSKRREHKDDLEKYVTSCVVDFLGDKNNAEVAVDEVLKYLEKRSEEGNLKSVQSRIANVRKEIDALADSFVKAKNRLLQETIERKMNDYEILLNDLMYQEAKLELERGSRVSREDLLAFIAELIKGDINDKEYQRSVINHLVSAVYITDTDTVVYFNIKGGSPIETLDFDDTKLVLQGSPQIRMREALASHLAGDAILVATKRCVKTAHLFLLLLGAPANSCVYVGQFEIMYHSHCSLSAVFGRTNPATLAKIKSRHR